MSLATDGFSAMTSILAIPDALGEVRSENPYARHRFGYGTFLGNDGFGSHENKRIAAK
jgi:hypothetical protein